MRFRHSSARAHAAAGGRRRRGTELALHAGGHRGATKGGFP